jgi:predicted ArsR family transcriptional regulator
MSDVKISPPVPADMREVTVNEVAENMGVEYLVAYSIVQCLVAKGLAFVTGHRKQPGRGKPATLYSVPETVQFNL